MHAGAFSFQHLRRGSTLAGTASLGMARLLPSDISQLALTGAREPELKTLRQLQAKLPFAYSPGETCAL